MFSVIIPVYNRSQLLRRALESLVGQTYQSFEAVIVDDGSAEDIKSVVDAFGDPRFKLTRVPNMGAGIARNIAIGLATQEWIAFLDSDDWWPAEKLAAFQKHIADQPSVNFVYSGFQFFDESTGSLGQTFIDPPPPDIRRQILIHNFVYALPTVAVRKKFLMLINGFDRTFPARQDVDLYVRLADHVDFSFVPRSLCFVSHNAKGRISSTKTNRMNGFRLFYEKFKNRMDWPTRFYMARRIVVYAMLSRKWSVVARYVVLAVPSVLIKARGEKI